MSVTTSSANVDPPPLLFGQRSPTPPAFASFSQATPQSPRSPRSHPPHADDADMSQHVPLANAPSPGHSDSEDSEMDDTESSVGAPPSQATHSGAGVGAVVGAVVGGPSAPGAPPAVTFPPEQDAMDTTPDAPGSIAFGFPNGPALSFGNMDNFQPPPPPPPNEAPARATGENLTRINSHSSSIDSSGDMEARPPEPPPPIMPPAQSAPGSPRDEEAVIEHDHEDSSDEEDVLPPWRELKEDMSAPDEHELREIEAMGEASALDREHWEKKTFQELDDPEYTAGATGRLDWTITNYNGTRENPNRELVMKSPVINVGGYDWQIKFYPRGNDSDFLSIYVECLTVAKTKEDQKDEEPTEHVESSSQGGKPQQSSHPQSSRQQPSQQEYQQGPLPLLTKEPIPKRLSVAAQVAVVLYSPSEPRVNYYRQCSHRFCPDSPDWGWTRFAGPHYEIHYRQRGHRQALLRNDTLAFSAYIRIVNDPTECLWEHHSRENRWDSYAMTGLQGLADAEYESHGGSFISAISSWMLLKPFRQFLYDLSLPDPIRDARTTPKPVLAALQRTLYRLRTDVHPGSGPVDLDDIADAVAWYGTDSCFSKLDVIEIWEVLRAKVEFELADMPNKHKFAELFGPERDRMTNIPTYRAPVKCSEDVQAAIDKSPDLVHPTAPLPQVLHVELDRQEFNRETRSMKKLSNKVKIRDRITVKGTSYILYGFVAHRDSLQSGSYYSVLRPRGPGNKWYAYYDGKEENRVVCLTKKQAIDRHEGGGSDKAPVAYILMYVRQNVVAKQFSKEEPKWDVPQWLESSSSTSENNTKEDTLEYQVFLSDAFLSHEGPGIIDPSDPKWTNSPHMTTMELAVSASAKDIRDALAQKFEAKDPRQVKFWFLDHTSAYHPNLRSGGAIEDSHGNLESGSGWNLKIAADNWPERRIWMHMVDVESLPELPPPAGSTENDGSTNANHEGAAVDHGGDSPMSDADNGGDPTDEQMDLVITEGLAAQAARQHHVDVTAELDFPLSRPQPPAAIPSNDTEMGNALDVGQSMPPPPPPPPPADLITPPLQSINDNVVVITNSNLNPLDFAIPPPAPSFMTSHDEIYFFLKTFEAETQTLKAHKSVVAKKSARIDHTVLDALNQPHDTPLDIFDEDGPTIASKLLRSNISFGQASIHNSAVLIAQAPLTAEQRSSLADRALFADPSDFIPHATTTRFATASTPLTGHFTMDYFSSEHYIGMLVRGRPHGHGRRLYFDGGEYVGSFRLGQRHGHGRHTHPNGDVYEGEWASDLPEGRGSFVEEATGNSYLGGWKAGKKFGEGVTHWKNAQEVERLCRICWEEGADAAFYDCGHVVACLGCARRVDTCPVCRKRVLSAMKLFFGN